MRSQEFLQGHTNRVSVVACSKSGRYLASGQLSHQGFSAAIIIWDLPGRKKLHEMSLHKVKVQALDFSCDDEYLISSGGQDDCKLVAWRVSTGIAICGSPVPLDFATAVKFVNNDPHKLVTAGDFKLIVWELDVPNRMLEPQFCDVGRFRRIHTSLVIDAKDEFMYVATHTGDILRVSLGPKLFRNGGPKPIIELGVMSICSTQHGHLLAGGGDGSLTLLENETLRIMERCKLVGAVSSVVLAETHGNSFACYAGTNKSNIYLIKYDGRKQKFMPPELVQSCHYNKINDIAFPAGYSDVFATASTNDVRMWDVRDLKELLRIQVPNEWCDYKDSANQECLCLAFMPDGKSIITGWADGKIRAFGPQTGKLQYTIVDAHSTAGKNKAFQGVTALCPTSDSCRIVSGGVEGRVRVWRVGNQSHSLIASMKEHRGAISGVQVRKNDTECISCSSDGSCIIWDLTRFARNNSFYASTFFKAAMYHPDESQLLTTGTDRKITWWDAYDCQPIRILDGSLTSEVYSIDISPDGAGMVSAGVDREVKLWNYDEGHNYFVGHGHSKGEPRSAENHIGWRRGSNFDMGLQKASFKLSSRG
ncbi:hypothetical protein AXG93_815s1330 [Marchantia polymorpha subsp. ruderalis]|uniref:Cilia- and flagella-associated protein 52 n=1 Tax=Marchantia polymorpha subsp. ruderalis TaxID=1480154 RepID=A0A176W1N6_MARPO|nr:hypothetical protein AXG93_815s1330 [Marchantia polymorpha subsp. ruderalis]